MKLLKQLYETYSPSGKETKMVDFIENYCKKEGVVIARDAHALYVTKGKAQDYPCVIAHTDQVQDAPCKCYQAGDIIFGLTPNGKAFQGLGADDKNGIWIALKCFDTFDTIKLAFFNDEERGCVGSSHANVDFFKDCRFVIQCDRKGGQDFIQSISGTKLCSEDFIKDADLKKYGFKREFGMMTDVQKLRNMGVTVSCCNISCGYYEPHTDGEYTVISELKNTLAFVKNIIKKCTKVYTYEPEVKSYAYGNYGGGYGGGYNGGYSGDWYGGQSLYDRVFDLEDEARNTAKTIGELMKRVGGIEKLLLKKKMVDFDDLPEETEY